MDLVAPDRTILVMHISLTGNYMDIIVFGLNHKTAPVEIREKVFICDADTPVFLQKLKENGIDNAVIISTCNRTEIYCAVDDTEDALGKLKRAVSAFFRFDMSRFGGYTYLFRNEDTFRHLFLVASGLDSMVLGEPQILGQVKDAYRLSSHHHASGFYLNKLFHRAFQAAKRVRSETKIGYNPLSISSMAVELSKRIFGELPARKILVIGAGEMCEIALKHFKKEGIQEIFITNRTYAQAQKLSDEIMGVSYPFDKIPDLLTVVDMVLSSTGSEKPIIDRNSLLPVMRKRKNRPLFFIDIAVPRDVDPLVNNIDNVYLYDIDDLKELSQKHLADRIAEAERAEAIIEEEVQKFNQWLEMADLNPVISYIVQKAEEIRQSELKKIEYKLKDLDETASKNIDMLTRSIVNKILHLHITALKDEMNPENKIEQRVLR